MGEAIRQGARRGPFASGAELRPNRLLEPFRPEGSPFMGNDKHVERPSFDEYLADLLSRRGFSDASAARRVHEQNLQSALIDVQKSDALKVIDAELLSMQQRYLGGRPDLLFSSEKAAGDLQLQIKPFDSTMLKVYRTNVLFNKRFPSPSQYEIPEDQIYERIDDLLRGRIVCRYIDGPRFVCEELEKRCALSGIEFSYRTLNTPAGYYAWHVYFRVTVPFIEGRAVVDRPLWVELQISTQLAEVITALTHSVYEARRVGAEPPNGWHWLPSLPEFKSAYLGHGLHLLEGVIQGFRDDVLGKTFASQESGAGEIVDGKGASNEH